MHAGVLVKFVGNLVLTFNSEANFGEAAFFENGKGVQEKHASKTSAAVVSANSKLAHPAEGRIFVTKCAADELIIRF